MFIPAPEDQAWMRLALRLARRGRGCTSPNPMVGAVLVKGGRLLGRGWHHRAGAPHAEIEALNDARRRGHSARGATLYVSLEPCSTTGRTPPCTSAILEAGIERVVVAAIDPNPAHAGRGLEILRQKGVRVENGLLAEEAAAMNAAFNHWIVHRTPWVTVKAAMTLDGKIATAGGESKWITGEPARQQAMRLRWENDAVLVGIGTVLADDPALTLRLAGAPRRPRPLLRVVLDSRARTPLTARVLADDPAAQTVVVVGPVARRRRVEALAKRVQVWQAPAGQGGVDLEWVLAELGRREVTALLVEGGGEVQAAFLSSGLAHQIAFFYAPLVLGGRQSCKAVAGAGATHWGEVIRLQNCRWRQLGADRLLTARVAGWGDKPHAAASDSPE